MIKEHRKWMDIVTTGYDVTEEELMKYKTRYVCTARKMFYSLCLRDGISLTDLSRYFGKSRMNANNIIKNNVPLDRNKLNELWKENQEINRQKSL